MRWPINSTTNYSKDRQLCNFLFRSFSCVRHATFFPSEFLLTNYTKKKLPMMMMMVAQGRWICNDVDFSRIYGPDIVDGMVFHGGYKHTLMWCFEMLVWWRWRFEECTRWLAGFWCKKKTKGSVSVDIDIQSVELGFVKSVGYSSFICVEFIM